MKRTLGEPSTPRDQKSNVSRRELLVGGMGLGLVSAFPQASAAAALPEPRDAQQQAPAVIASTNTGLVQTSGGKVAGYIRNEIYTYKGIPYAASTGGANRFQPPQPLQAWSGVRSCRHWGPIAPQMTRNDGRHNDEESFLFDWIDATQRVYSASEGEDCLCLNIWAPGIGDGKNRPVMFWIHGGAFTNGSGNEQHAYDGENLARRGDLVVVSMNHRLNAFGYLDLTHYGDQFKFSANVGMLDLVAALAWVRDNIALFGGDPGCVTVFGQSGGGAKTGMLMGMPAAKGLIHRAAIQSGSMPRATLQTQSRKFADEIVQELGLDQSTIARIQDLPMEEILRAAQVVMHKQLLKPETERLSFGPILDGVTIPAHPFYPRASELSANIPLMVGSTLNEFTSATNHPELAAMTEAELEDRVREKFNSRADAILKVYRDTMPQSTPFARWSAISCVPNRNGAIQQCAAKAELGKAPAYLFWFTWKTPLLDERPGAFHCADIPFVFANTDLCDTMTGGGARPRILAEKVSDAWIHFARTGDPNHPNIPQWTPFDAASVPTMIFDDQVRVALNPDGEQRKIVNGA